MEYCKEISQKKQYENIDKNLAHKSHDTPYIIKKFTQAVSFRQKLLSMIGIFLFSLQFFGIIFFLLCVIYGNTLIKTLAVLITILQMFVKKRISLYGNFLQYLGLQYYFKSFTFILEEKFDDEKSLFAIHPHGITAVVFSTSLLNNFLELKDCITLGTRLIRYIPFSGLFARMVGIEGVDQKNFRENMKNRKNIFFIPGGFECATITDNDTDRIFIKNRKGFIKYALMYGYKLYPIYNFGENRMYYTFKKWKIFEQIGLLMNKIKFPGIFFIGKYLFFPRCDVDVATVIGKGIQFPKIENPTKEEIKSYHDIYIKNLQCLYDKYKNQFGSSDKLDII